MSRCHCLSAVTLVLLLAGCANNPSFQGTYASTPVGVWGYSSYPGYAYGSYGSYGGWNHSTGVAYGAYGGSAAWSNGAGYAHGAYGGSAAWNHGSESRMALMEALLPGVMAQVTRILLMAARRHGAMVPGSQLDRTAVQCPGTDKVG